MKKILNVLFFFPFVFCVYAEASNNIVIIVNNENPISEINRPDLIKIYLGKKSLFENGTKIIPVDLAERTSLKIYFYQSVLLKDIDKLKTYWIKRIFSGRGSPPETFKKVKDIKNFVANNEGAIAYIDRSDIDKTIKAVKFRGE